MIAAIFKRIPFTRLYFDTVVRIFVFAAEQVDFIGDFGIRCRGVNGDISERCVLVRDKHICGLHLRIRRHFSYVLGKRVIVLLHVVTRADIALVKD